MTKPIGITTAIVIAIAISLFTAPTWAAHAPVWAQGVVEAAVTLLAIALFAATYVLPIWIMRRVTRSNVHGFVYGTLIGIGIDVVGLCLFMSLLPRC